jgi:hypothetical protein
MTKHQPLSFTPEQASRLSGVSPDRQRNWRKLGILSATGPGWTRYDLEGVCGLFLLNAFTSMGIDASRAKPAVQRLAPVLAADLEARMAGGEFGTTSGPRAAIVWANGDVGTYPTVQHGFDQSVESQTAGPTTVFDMPSLATPLMVKIRDLIAA